MNNRAAPCAAIGEAGNPIDTVGSACIFPRLGRAAPESRAGGPCFLPRTALPAGGERSRRDNMFAVIKTGGKQYKVAMNDVILVEKLEVEVGQDVTFDEILMVGQDTNLKVGSPLVQGASVLAKVLDQAQADKVLIFKKNRRHNYRRKRGHRQRQTVLRITEIKAA